MEKKKILIVGLNKITNNIFNKLSKYKEFDVYILDRKRVEDLPYEKLFVGNITLEETYKNIDINSFNIAVVATENEDINLFISLIIASLNRNIKVITTINEEKIAKELYLIFPNILVISPKKTISPLFFALTIDKDSVGFYTYKNEFYIVKKKEATHVYYINNLVPEQKIKENRFVLFKKKLFGIIQSVITEEKIAVYAFFTLIFYIFGISFFFFANKITSSLLDAVYLSTAIVTTIGFGDLNLLNTAGMVRIIGIIFMFIGTIFMGIFNATIVNLFITQRIKNIQGIFDLPKKDHIVIIGLGVIGREVLNLIKKFIPNNKVIAIDPHVQEALSRELETPIIIASGEDEEVLKKVNITEARSILIVTNNDVVNLHILLLLISMGITNTKIIYRINELLIKKYALKNIKGHFVDVNLLMEYLIIINIINLSRQNRIIGLLYEESNINFIVNINVIDFPFLREKTFIEIEKDYDIKLIPQEHQLIQPYDLFGNYMSLVFRGSLESIVSLSKKKLTKLSYKLHIKSIEGMTKNKDAIDILEKKFEIEIKENIEYNLELTKGEFALIKYIFDRELKIKDYNISLTM